MAQQEALLNNSYTNRVRVRTPGKYVFVFLFAPVIIVAIVAGFWLNHAKEQSRLAALEYRTSKHGVETAYFSLPEMLVDLAVDQDGRKSYLKMNVTIVLNENNTKQTARLISDKQPLISERLTFFLRILRPEDFSGAEAMERMKAELKHRINLIIAPDMIENVIIEDLIIQ